MNLSQWHIPSPPPPALFPNNNKRQEDYKSSRHLSIPLDNIKYIKSSVSGTHTHIARIHRPLHSLSERTSASSSCAKRSLPTAAAGAAAPEPICTLAASQPERAEQELKSGPFHVVCEARSRLRIFRRKVHENVTDDGVCIVVVCNCWCDCNGARRPTAASILNRGALSARQVDSL